MTGSDVLLDGLALPEGPRWRQDRLVFSDMLAGEVVAVDMTGTRETIAAVPNRPSGLGWLPDGRMLVVSMLDRRLLIQMDGGLREAADLSPVTTDRCNDMVVDRQGRAYVGDYPVPPGATAAERHANAIPSNLVLVDFGAGAVARPRIVADGLYVPNGAVITPDGGTLIVAETGRNRLTAFTIAADGSLTGRRVWAELTIAPDGICLDMEGCIWVATPYAPSVVQRIAPGGRILAQVAPGSGLAAFACALGGPARRTLFTLEAAFPPAPERKLGRVRRHSAPVAGV
jgi:sugar lactone lactonase YvrE